MKNYTKQQITNLAINLKRKQIPCKLLKVNGELDIILGTNYPEELGAQVSSIIKNLNIEANIVGSATYYKNNPKVEMELNVYGGPKDYTHNPGKDFMFEKLLSELIKEETSKLIKENRPSPKAFDLGFKNVRDAFQEAYEAETGNIFQAQSIDYDNINVKEIIIIKNLIINREKIGDITLIKYPEGWRFRYKKINL